MDFIVIGITDAPHPWFPPDVLEIIKSGRVFSGGKRHRDIVAHLLPNGAEWIDITVPLEAVFMQYKQFGGEATEHIAKEKTTEHVAKEESTEHTIIVFASGDPLFFGFATTLQRQFPAAGLKVYPSFNSLQMLAHRSVMRYDDMRVVSLTGRPWHEFDRALLEHAPKIGVLTDRTHTPATIAQRMIDYGYTSYRMWLGERLGHPTCEQVRLLRLDEALTIDFEHPNCLILEATASLPPRRFGIPDDEFELLDGRSRMITKMPIRLLSLQALGLSARKVLWDIGFCTGSVSIEAKLQFPHLQVVSFEIRPEGERLMNVNACRFGALGIDAHIGDFLQADLDALPRPDAVFIGGHGGRLKEIMARLAEVMPLDGCIVMNSVTSSVVQQMTDLPSSHVLWNEACAELGLHQAPPLRIQLNDYNPIEILICKK